MRTRRLYEIGVFTKSGTASLWSIETYQLIEQWTDDGVEADMVQLK